MAAIRVFAPSDLCTPQGFPWHSQAGGEVGFMCWRSVWVGGRISRASSPLEGTRDPPRRSHFSSQESWRWLLCVMGDLESPLHFPEFLFLVRVKKFPCLGHASCFWADTVEKLHFLRKLGELLYWFFFSKCALFLLQTKAPALGHEGLCFPWKINPSAAPSRTVFSHCPVGNGVGCFSGAVAEEPSVLSFAVSLAYAVIRL